MNGRHVATYLNLQGWQVPISEDAIRAFDQGSAIVNLCLALPQNGLALHDFFWPRVSWLQTMP